MRKYNMDFYERSGECLSIKNTLRQIAKKNGYDSEYELLRDYGIVPTVRMPNHKKIELIPLLLRHLKGQK